MTKEQTEKILDIIDKKLFDLDEHDIYHALSDLKDCIQELSFLLRDQWKS